MFSKIYLQGLSHITDIIMNGAAQLAFTLGDDFSDLTLTVNCLSFTSLNLTKHLQSRVAIESSFKIINDE
jgi:hypothetical protein